MLKKMVKNRGFTLIELLVVIAIIALLSSVVLASLNTARSKSRDAQRVAQLRQVQSALEMFYLQNGTYPVRNPVAECANSWDSPIGQLVSAGFLSAVPRDPINDTTHCYNYVSSSNSSNWYCGGVRRTDYEWAIVFTLENDTNTFPKVTSATQGTHCFLGARK